MRYALPILILLVTAALLLMHDRRSRQDAKWQAVRQSMLAMQAKLRPGMVIGCPVDSNHTRIFYECRYHLAPLAVLQGNAPERDTQLLLLAKDERPVLTAIHLPAGDTLLSVSNAYLSAILLKSRP